MSEAGDLLFYLSKPTSLFDFFIVANNHMRGLNTDIVHVAIDIGENELIEAGSNGIIQRVYSEEERFVRWHSKGRIENVDIIISVWLKKCIGMQYGWGDVVQSAFTLSAPFFVIDSQHYDCSVLAALFLQHCLYSPFLDNIEKSTNMYNITPAMLAKELGIK